MIKRKLDWIRGPTSPFKYKAIKPVVTKLPIRHNLKSLQSPVHDQGQSGSCVGNAVSNALEFLQLQAIRAKSLASPEVFQELNYDPISRMFIYYNARAMEGATNMDSGCNIFDAVASIQQSGFCQESTWPFDLSQVYTQPSQTAYSEALKHRAATAYSIESLDDVKSCINSGFPVVFGTDVYQSFEDLDSTGVYAGPTDWEQPLGGHCMLAVAYDDYYESITVKNSWGTEFGDNGYAYISYDFAQGFADMHTIR